MALPGIGPLSGVAASTTASTTSYPEDPNKKIRKPYTISKSRESWTEPEHDKFLEALQLFDRDWKKIEAFVGSKTVIQIRSHAQKYFLKVQKSGISEHLPPPRPKRKAAHPYPQKASKNSDVPPLSQVSGSVLAEPGNVQIPDSSLRSPFTSADISSRTNNSVYSVNLSQERKAPCVANKSCSSTESAPRERGVGETTDLGNHGHQLRVLPDFARVYSFIGSVFDPEASDHLQNLRKMDQIDVETVLLLMRNLSINLTSPDFENQRRLLSSHAIESEASNHSDASKIILEAQPTNVT